MGVGRETEDEKEGEGREGDGRLTCIYQMRAAIVVDVFRKSLTLSNSARNKTSPGI